MTAELSRRPDARIPSDRGEEIDAWMFLPDGPGPHPVVVMAMAPVGLRTLRRLRRRG
jgi:dienelactone hydrolase